MSGNAGFLAVAALALALLFLASRGFDGGERLRYGGGVDTPEVRVERGVRELFIERAPTGAYVTRAEVNGAPVAFLVDTGASYVTLTARDARAAGIEERPGAERATFSTANGVITAVEGEPATIAIGPVTLDEVTVYILPDAQLDVSLLGVDALERFGSVNFTGEGITIAVD